MQSSDDPVDSISVDSNDSGDVARRATVLVDRYKTLIEIGVATLLGLMAIVVSITQACSAQRQTRLLELQTQIAEAQAVPQFALKRLHSKDGELITVENKGGLVRIARADTFDTLHVRIYRPGSISSGWVRIGDYLDDGAQELGFVANPTLFSLPLPTERRRAITTFRRELERYTYRVSTFYKRDEVKFRAVGVISFIRIEYRDILDRERVAWFIAAERFESPETIPILPARIDEIPTPIQDALADEEADETIPIDRKVTPDTVCRFARLALQERSLVQ